jgi:adenylate cyclase class 2
MRHSVDALGVKFKGNVFETNIRYEDKNNTLIQKKSLLRLRQDEKTTLTFKSSPSANNRDFKIFKELEVEVDDFATMGRILEMLGFHPEQKYEKWRETLTLGPVGLFLDRMPFGEFLEIEGQDNDIRDCAAKLGLNWNKRILLSYLEIFDVIKEKLNLRFKNLTFKNFETVNVDITSFLNQLEAGNP